MFHVKHSSPHVLLINPWITDFAAYNFWIKPLGLLSIGSLLRQQGLRVSLVDCLDFHVRKSPYGDGKFFRTIIEKPKALGSVPRNFSQYGIPESVLRDRLISIDRPDLICITSGMTYWYPGLFKVIRILKQLFKGVPVLLGGIYASLCYEHARQHSGADFIFQGNDDLEALKLISELANSRMILNPLNEVGQPPDCGFRSLEHSNPQSLPVREALNRSGTGQAAEIRNILTISPYPAFDLYSQLDYVCIRTSTGCPLRCTYCASPVLHEKFVQRDPLDVVDEIQFWVARYNVRNVVFYDDALLVESSSRILPILEELIRRNVRPFFHTPNGLHVREVDRETASLLLRSQFKTIRLGFETSNEIEQHETGGKVDNPLFQKAVLNLRKTGFLKHEIGVYIMAGLPRQVVGHVAETITFVRRLGARPILVEYSPVPGTPLFAEAKRASHFDIENEPLYHNNSILPCQWEGFTPEDLMELKGNVKEITS
jgi:radical SAM superfamily enzyme YgiQ (UPF0313 family)